jgi:hypothetical protein
MKNLVRNNKGSFVVKTAEPQIMFNSEPNEMSPIVTETNFPKQIIDKPIVRKGDLSSSLALLTEEKLLDEMRKAGGKNLVTEQFAILITPKVKRSEDENKHHLWDIAHSRIRFMMRSLNKKGLVIIHQSSTTGKYHFVYDLKE